MLPPCLGINFCMATEIWHPVVGFEDEYEVSDLGRVRSIARQVVSSSRWGTERLYTVQARVLRTKINRRDKHEYIALRQQNYAVHVLVLTAFVGPSLGRETRHLDGDPVNNWLSNLCWGSRAANMRDRKYHDGQVGHKLTPNQVREIKSLLDEGERGTIIARRYGISNTAVSNIKHRRTHTDVP